MLFFVALSLDGVLAAPRNDAFLGPDGGANVFLSVLTQMVDPKSELAQTPLGQIFTKFAQANGFDTKLQEKLNDPLIISKLSKIASDLLVPENYPKLSLAASKVEERLRISGLQSMFAQITSAVGSEKEFDLNAEKLLSIVSEASTAGAVRVTLNTLPVHLAENSCVSTPSKSAVITCSSDNKKVTVASFDNSNCGASNKAAKPTLKTYNVPAIVTELGQPLPVECDAGVLVATQSDLLTLAVYNDVSCSAKDPKLTLDVRADGQCHSVLKMTCNKAGVTSLSQYDSKACLGEPLTSVVPQDRCFEMAQQGVKFYCVDEEVAPATEGQKGLSVPLIGGGTVTIPASVPMISTSRVSVSIGARPSYGYGYGSPYYHPPPPVVVNVGPTPVPAPAAAPAAGAPAANSGGEKKGLSGGMIALIVILVLFIGIPVLLIMLSTSSDGTDTNFMVFLGLESDIAEAKMM